MTKREIQAMTLRDAIVRLAAVNVTIRRNDGEYRVNLRGGREATAYYTDDLADAVGTGESMARAAKSGATAL